MTVARYPAIDSDCRHQVFIEHGTIVERIDLPAIGRVDVSQQFVARVGEQLSFEYVVLLQAGHDSRFGLSSVTADLINLTAQTRISLINRSVTSRGELGDKRLASRRENRCRFPLVQQGRTSCVLPPRSTRKALAHRRTCSLTQYVFVIFPGTTITQLASVSCVGCVQL